MTNGKKYRLMNHSGTSSSLDKENDKEKNRKKVSSYEGLQIPLPEVVSASIANIGKGKKREMQEGNEDEGVGNVRWLRVNTLKWTVEACVEWFENERWELVEDIETMLEVSYVLSYDSHSWLNLT